MGGTLGFWRLWSRWGDVRQILHETGAVDQIAVKCLNPFYYLTARTMRLALAGRCALPLFFEVAIVLLISVALLYGASYRRKHGEAGHSAVCGRGGSRGVFIAQACADAAGRAC